VQKDGEGEATRDPQQNLRKNLNKIDRTKEKDRTHGNDGKENWHKRSLRKTRVTGSNVAA
jgi:hypothetical protein